MSSGQTAVTIKVLASNTSTYRQPNGVFNLEWGCSDPDCSGLGYSRAGYGVSGSSSSLNIAAPCTAGTYTVRASKSGSSPQT